MTAIIVGITLILGVVIFEYLVNVDNPSQGNELSETIVFQTNIERLNAPNNAICDIESVTDLEGNPIDPSEYYFNNCEVVYTP